MTGMTIHAHQYARNQWVLGRNRREVDASGQYGHNGARRFDFDGFWTGEKWARGMRPAKHFLTETAAYTYIEDNLALLEQSPVKALTVERSN